MDLTSQHERYITLKQNLMMPSSTSRVSSEVPTPTSMSEREKSETIHEHPQEEEQKTGPITRHTPAHELSSSYHTSSSSGGVHSISTPNGAPLSTPTLPHSATMSPPPPPPSFNFNSYGNRAEWPMTQPRQSSRPPLPPSYPTNQYLHQHHLHAPRPQYDHSNSGASRMRGDGFLLDAEDEPDCLDLSNSSESDPLPMQLNRSISSTMPDEDRPYGSTMSSMMISDHMMERPRSAGPSYTSIGGTNSQPIHRSTTGDSTATSGSTLQLVCPSCGVQPPGADAESFHVHVSRCFVTQLTASPSRRTPGHSNSTGDSGGPIRKARGRASSAAASTGSAAELASALANAQTPSTPESHGYHPYQNGSSASLTNTLRQLRRTVDQLDLHQRISIMEAFHRLSRVAMAEQQQALTPRGKGKLRSATNSPSPKMKPLEDKVCSNIMNLLYSPRITAPHPSPSFAMSGLHIGVPVPSPLRIGVSHAQIRANNNNHENGSTAMDTNSSEDTLPTILSSPIDPLELGAVHLNPIRKSYLFTPASPVDPMSEVSPSPIDGEVFSPSILVTDPDGSESEAGGLNSSLALTGAFVQGLSNASSPSNETSSPSAPPSEQTSPSGTSTISSVTTNERTQSGSEEHTFATHGYPNVNAASQYTDICNSSNKADGMERQQRTTVLKA